MAPVRSPLVRSSTQGGLHIGLISSQAEPDLGGVATLVGGYARALRRAGHQVTVLCQTREKEICHEVTDEGIEVARYPVRLGGHRFAFAPGLPRAARKLVGTCDVFHAFSYHAPVALGCSWAGVRPFVFSPVYHGGGHTPLAKAVHQVYRPFSQRLFDSTDLIVCLTRAEAEDVEADFGVPQSKVLVVPPAVEAVPDVNMPWSARQPVVLSAGRLDAYKGNDVLVEAFDRLHAPDAQLLVTGLGPDSERLHNFAAQSPSSERIKFLGFVDYGTLRELQGAARVAVSLSQHESFGLSLVEAAVMGARIVASDIPAHREALQAFAGSSEFVDVGAGPEVVAAAVDRALGALEPAATGPESGSSSSVDGLLQAYRMAVDTSP